MSYNLVESVATLLAQKAATEPDFKLSTALISRGYGFEAEHKGTGGHTSSTYLRIVRLKKETQR